MEAERKAMRIRTMMILKIEKDERNPVTYPATEIPITAPLIKITLIATTTFGMYYFVILKKSGTCKTNRMKNTSPKTAASIILC